MRFKCSMDLSLRIGYSWQYLGLSWDLFGYDKFDMSDKAIQSTEQQPDEWQQDLNPNQMAGQNHGLDGSHPEKDAPTAAEIKELHSQLADYTNDELKQIPVLPSGSRLEQGAKYIDLHDPERQEFTAMGNMEAGPDNLYVPKTEVSYQLWNRLTKVQNPARLEDNKES